MNKQASKRIMSVFRWQRNERVEIGCNLKFKCARGWFMFRESVSSSPWKRRLSNFRFGGPFGRGRGGGEKIRDRKCPWPLSKGGSNAHPHESSQSHPPALQAGIDFAGCPSRPRGLFGNLRALRGERGVGGGGGGGKGHSICHPLAPVVSHLSVEPFCLFYSWLGS